MKTKFTLRLRDRQLDRTQKPQSSLCSLLTYTMVSAARAWASLQSALIHSLTQRIAFFQEKIFLFCTLPKLPGSFG